jgi:hypothetical protein
LAAEPVHQRGRRNDSSIGRRIYHFWIIPMADGRIFRFNLDAIELALKF